MRASINTSSSIDKLNVAIIGMAARFPGARNITEFWQNLCAGVESISFFTEEELKSSGEDTSVLKDPLYVKARGTLEDVELFDASFFGFYPREAQLMDPQHRIFLECAWEAIEDAGYDTDNYEGLVGVFGGAGINSYLSSILSPNPGNLSPAEGYQLAVGNHNDFLTARVSYKLNLRGPSLNIQTACSTSLVAVHIACRSLLGHQCDMALAGGVSVGLPQKRGYLFQDGMILSPDGHCRPFDATARGTVAGNGVGIVVLKRLADAIADGDHIYAVIKGSAVNNDGSLRVGFTAPGVEGQAEVITTAQAIAGVDLETITYIEAHGTGTALGDPIEIAALKQAYREKTEANGFCAIGSVKSNIGHLDTAAGVAGLIKTALALKHQLIPPSLNFEQSNPEIDFQNSPFYVNTSLSAWESVSEPRRAGVSSFGIGGTNAHVVLEEAPSVEVAGSLRPWQLLVLSAKTDSALETATARLAAHLREHSDSNLADLAYTLQIGRKAFNHRRILVCQSVMDAWSALENRDPKRVFSTSHTLEPDDRPVVFMFSGQGSQYVNMGVELYQIEPTFREVVDYCSDFLKPNLDLDLRELLYPPAEKVEEAIGLLNQTRITQPALFVVEYALARLWMEWGVQPQAMIGHSIGEYVAACLAGVCSLQDALKLVAVRGSLMQGMPGGAMLSLSLEEPEVRSLLSEGLSLAAINGPSSCVVSGPHDAIAELEHQLTKNGVIRLHTSHAFHSEMMEPILEPFAREFEQVDLRPPRVPYMSNLTGTWITTAQAMDPGYYTKHLRRTVRFAEGISGLLKESNSILLEIGPGQTLSTLVRQHRNASGRVILTSMHHPHEEQSDVSFILNTLGKLWLAGVKIDWPGFYTRERRLRTPLPTYPFEPQRYWIDEKEPASSGFMPHTVMRKHPVIADWVYVPSWKRSDLPKPFNRTANEKTSWLLFIDDRGLGSSVAERLRHEGHDVITVETGEKFEQICEYTYTLDPLAGNEYQALVEELGQLKSIPPKIAHFWSVMPNDEIKSGSQFFERAQALGYFSLLFLAQALGKQNITDRLKLWVISTNLQEVTGEELLYPEKATLLGPCQVIPQEYPNITCHSLDLIIRDSVIQIGDDLVGRLINEFFATESEARAVAYRGIHRWVHSYEAMPLDTDDENRTKLRQGGVYLITGGLGNIGLTLAQHLAQTVLAKLILIGRSAFPMRNEWDRWLRTHDERDQVSRKIRKLTAIEEVGSEVVVLSADVANEQQMRKVIDQAYDRFGQIHGVIHAAGVVGEKSIRTIQEMSSSESNLQFRAKIEGVRVLAKILQGRELDFCLLQSSLSSILGGLGFAAYSAANHYLDAFAHKQSLSNGTPWISVNWDDWQFDEGRKQDANIGATTAEFALSPVEGCEVFRRILSGDVPSQIVISTGDLQARIDQWVKRKPVEGQKSVLGASSSTSFVSRPNLQTRYIAPSNELEQRIVEVWQNLLGLEPVGICDNFFELGGDSLLGTQLVAQLRNTFRIEFPLRSLFEDPTVAGTAKIIEAAMKDKPQLVDKLAEVFKKVEELSEAEAHALVAEIQVR